MKPLFKEDLDSIFEYTRELWEPLRNQQIFITGGTGFFGVWFLESILYASRKLNLDLKALVLTRSKDTFRKRVPYLFNNSEIEFLEGDVRNFVYPQGKFSHVIHAATSAQRNAENPLEMLDTIITGTHHVLEFAKQAGTKHLLFTSSGAVYGRQPANLSHISEEDGGGPEPTDFSSAYAEGKRTAELLCTLYHKQFGIDVKIARCYALVGPHLPLNAQYAIGNFISDGLSGRPIEVKGDGTPYRSYLYAADLMIWLWKIFFKGVPCRPYNVGSEDAISISDLASRVASLFNVEVQILKKSIPNQIVEQYVPSTKRASYELGLKTWVPLGESLKRTIQWYHSAESK
ncbi:MAG: NAD-dependent epimerase/dehydratase family protein [Deltaproteobacteria bacterium]|nr:NAD-dependent epimerase/dehydratase family protein [Deltaproteobacteria bacterium]